VVPHAVKQLAARVVASRPRKTIRFVAGADCAFPKDREKCVAAVVLWDMEERSVLEEHDAIDYAVGRASEYVEDARKTLSALPLSPFLEHVRRIGDFVLRRKW